MSDLEGFLKARSIYRKAVSENPTFSYGDMVPEPNPKSLYESTGIPSLSGRYQVMADVISADSRARDMQKMTWADYLQAFSSAAQHQDEYEAYRLKKFRETAL